MKTNEQFSLQELETLARAYLDCRLSRLQEKELEYVLSFTGLSSEVIDEARESLGICSLISAAGNHEREKAHARKRPGVYFRKWGSVAASLVIITAAAVIFLSRRDGHSSFSGISGYSYVCIDGKEITGHDADRIADKSREESIAMMNSILEEAERQQEKDMLLINKMKKI